MMLLLVCRVTACMCCSATEYLAALLNRGVTFLFMFLVDDLSSVTGTEPGTKLKGAKITPISVYVYNMYEGG